MPEPEESRPPAGGLLADYARYLSLERRLSPNTLAAYVSDLRQFLAGIKERGRTPEKASSGDISAWIESLSEKGLKASSVFRKLEAVKSFFAFQVSEGRMAASPAAAFRSPRQSARLPKTLSLGDIESLLGALGGEGFQALRLRAIVELLYASGIRVSELLGLKPEDLNLADGWVRVFGKGSRERLVPIPESVARTLRRYQEIRLSKFSGKRQASELFLSRSGRRLGRAEVYKELRALGTRAQLSRPLHPHLLRHSFATHLLQGGADLRVVQEMLGHASLATTQIYTHLERSALKDAHRKFHPRG